MPKIHEMIDSQFLRKEDIPEGEAVVTITGIEEKNVAMEGQRPEMKWVLSFAKVKKGLVLNSTNIQLLAKVCGSDDTDDWVGKRVVLYVDENVTFGGKIVGGIRVRAVRRPPTTPMAASNRQPADDMEDDIPWQQ